MTRWNTFEKKFEQPKKKYHFRKLKTTYSQSDYLQKMM